jgi:hypothetical protein
VSICGSHSQSFLFFFLTFIFYSSLFYSFFRVCETQQEHTEDASEFARYLTSVNLFNDDVIEDRIQNLSLNREGYESQQERTTNRFFDVIAKQPSLAPLCDFIEDTECPRRSKKRRLVILTRGAPNLHKYDILNKSLLYFSHNLKLKGNEDVDLTTLPFTKKQADALYQPNSTSLIFRTIFSWLRETRDYYAYYYGGRYQEEYRHGGNHPPRYPHYYPPY